MFLKKNLKNKIQKLNSKQKANGLSLPQRNIEFNN